MPYMCSARVHVGYKPFVEACIEEEENQEALKYIVKLTNPEERAEVFSIDIFLQFLQGRQDCVIIV